MQAAAAYHGSFGAAQAERLLWRAGFGPRKGEAQKLAARKPLSLAQAASVPGVSPADLQNLILEIERSRS